jgi:hypothetical protein
MAILYEYFNGPRDRGEPVTRRYLRGQTFTPLVAHNITEIKLYVCKQGSGGIKAGYLRLYNSDASGYPTTVITQVRYSTSSWGNEGSYSWISFLIATPYPTLLASTTYVIVIYPDTSDVTGNPIWGYYSAGGYTRGKAVYSNNSGSSWATLGNLDFMFEEWGNPLPSGTKYYTGGIAGAKRLRMGFGF